MHLASRVAHIVNPVLIVIPTLDRARGRDTGHLATVTAGIETRVIVVHDKKRQGFTKTVNRGIRKRMSNEDVCLLNDDVTLFHYGWLRILQTALYSKKKYGLAGPTGRSKSSTARGQLGDRGLLEVRMLPFWCVLIKREAVDRLGCLDEQFIHYSSDTVYCDRARRVGWRCVWVKSVFLRHAFEASGFQVEWRKHDTKVRQRKRW